MNDSPYPLLTELLFTLGTIQSRVEAALEPIGLSWAKFNALSQLAASNGPLPFGTLADRCACVRSNITQLVDRLEAEGLVVRIHDTHDRRSVLAELTKKGRTRYSEGIEALERTENVLFAHLIKRQRSELLSTLDSLQRQE